MEFELLNRLRNSKGFGVHSPFAYSLIRNMIAENANYGFYAYQTIDFLFEEDKQTGRKDFRNRRLARFLVRIFHNLKVEKIVWRVNPQIKDIFKEVGKAVFSKMEFREYNKSVTSAEDVTDKTLFIFDFRYINELDYSDILNLGLDNLGVMMIAPPEGICERIYDSVDEGLILESEDIAFYFPRRKMMKQKYSFLYRGI